MADVKTEQANFPLNPNEDQMFIGRVFSRMIGRLYDLTEGSFSNETQCNAFKKQMNSIVYDYARFELFKYFDDGSFGENV